MNQPLRESPRAPVRLDALLQLESDTAIRVHVVDISESGARLEGPLGDASGDGELQLENGLTVECTVVRPGPNACGLRFGKLDEKQRSALRQLISPLVRSFEEEAVLTPRGPVELSAEGLLSGEMYERFGLDPGCSNEELGERGKEILAAVERAIPTSTDERKRRLVAVRKSFAHLKKTWADPEDRATYNKHAGLAGAREAPPPRGVQGHLEDISAAELLDSLREGRRNAELQIHVDNEPRGLVAVQGGACVGAHTADAEGEDALLVIARCRTGLFYVHYGDPRPDVKNMSGTAQSLQEAVKDARGFEEDPKLGPLPKAVRLSTPLRDDRKAQAKRTEPEQAKATANPPDISPGTSPANPPAVKAEPKPAAQPAPAKDNSTMLVVGAMLVLVIIVVVILASQ